MRRLAFFIGLTCLLAFIVAAGPHSLRKVWAASQDVRLSLVAYSTPRDAFGELIKAFQGTPQGRGVTVDESYGGSGEQSRAVQAGLPADVVAFSLQPDIDRLVKAGLVAPSWSQTKTSGMVTRSVVVFIVRKGNPKHISDWNDLIKPQVDVITPNPFTSGGARWNVVAAYGSQLKQGRSPNDAAAYLRALFSHVSVQDKSAREALQTFVGGKGDVMLAYESEAVLAQHKGMDVQYIVPRSTILIENPIAVLSGTQHPTEARALVDFFLSPAGQQVFAKYGYLRVDQPLSSEKGAGTFTIVSLGGWSSVDKLLFDPSSGLVARIEQDLGVSSGSR